MSSPIEVDKRGLILVRFTVLCGPKSDVHQWQRRAEAKIDLLQFDRRVVQDCPCAFTIQISCSENPMRQIFSALALFAAFGAGTAIAQTTDEKNVLAAHSAFEKAISALDVSAMEKVWVNAPYVVAIHPSSPAPVVGWESVKKTYADQVARNSELKVVLKDPKAHLLSPTTAYVTGIATVEAKRTNGETATFSANTINVYEKRGDQWLLVTHQATPIRKP